MPAAFSQSKDSIPDHAPHGQIRVSREDSFEPCDKHSCMLASTFPPCRYRHMKPCMLDSSNSIFVCADHISMHIALGCNGDMQIIIALPPTHASLPAIEQEPIKPSHAHNRRNHQISRTPQSRIRSIPAKGRGGVISKMARPDSSESHEKPPTQLRRRRSLTSVSAAVQ